MAVCYYIETQINIASFLYLLFIIPLFLLILILFFLFENVTHSRIYFVCIFIELNEFHSVFNLIENESKFVVLKCIISKIIFSLGWPLDWRWKEWV